VPLSEFVSFDPDKQPARRDTVSDIHDFRAYLELPILADALEEAGCDDGRILRHLRARTKGHDARCWVVNGLLGCGKAG
jgi:hypothetical protein